jgi:hypothetical protein
MTIVITTRILKAGENMDDPTRTHQKIYGPAKVEVHTYPDGGRDVHIYDLDFAEVEDD